MYPNPSPIDFSLPENYSLEAIDLTSCDREPIHIPGSIQPNGLLFLLSEESFKIIACSENAQEILPDPDRLFLKDFFQFVPEKERESLRLEIQQSKHAIHSPILLSLIGKDGHVISGRAVFHFNRQGFILEWEKLSEELGSSLETPDPIFFSDRLKRKNNFNDLVSEMASITADAIGYDRVMVYRFDKDWNGQVIAERKREDLPAYLDLHYPATDIPAQARLLYLKNTVRQIADVEYAPVRLISQIPTLHPVDLSLSKFRSVSPIHIRYLKNMGVSATLTISIIVEDKLWGLIACHHYSPKKIDLAGIRLMEWFSELFSLNIQLAAQRVKSEYSISISQNRDTILGKFSDLGLSWKQIMKESTGPGSLVHCNGSGVVFGGEAYCQGNSPSEDKLLKIASWLRKNLEDARYFATDSLSLNEFIPESIDPSIAGILAVPVGEDRKNWIFWFRLEYIQTIRWAGDPNDKPKELDAEGLERLSPRQSFEEFKQVLKGQSLPWLPEEIEGALKFEYALNKLVFNQIEKISGLKSEIQTLKIEEESAKQRLIEKQVLIKEIHHRVKNNLQVINSILYLQASYTENEETRISLLESQNRIRSMAIVHEMLYQSEALSRISTKTYFNQLTENILQTFDDSDNPCELKTHIDEVKLDLDTGIPLGLILNELLINAMKYGADSSGKRKIELQLDYEEEKSLSLLVRDFGKGLPPDLNVSKPKTLGLTLVQSLVKQLKAELQMKNDGGLSTRVLVPWKGRPL